MNVSDFDYHLPPELIAQHPAQHRQDARMLVLDRSSGRRQAQQFTDLPSYLRAGDCLVLNDTRVIPARLWGHRVPSGGRVQAFLLEELSAGRWQCLLRPGRRLPPGARVELAEQASGGFVVEAKQKDGTFHIRFDHDDVLAILDRAGKTPLPPYIDREPSEEDKLRYQTVYAREPGAVAAPTAGLHFTPEILAALQRQGVRIVRLTLHVGAGTFKPVAVERIEDHVMHEESYRLSPESADAINRCHDEGHRVFCVGTTTVRVLESCADGTTGRVKAGAGRTAIFLHPPRQPQVCDGLLTNFHLPQSTLLMLVCSFCSREEVMAAYDFAVKEQFRFYSYGDCMLLTP
jgi:S-adenosylmethionine:tRNA ribosyltransferase-isomerase